MQKKNRRKRIITIAKESVDAYRNRKQLILSLASLLLIGGVIYTYLMARVTLGNKTEVKQVITSKSALLQLEDSLSLTNKQLLQLNTQVEEQLRAERSELRPINENGANKVSKTNKQLIIRKIEAILKYLKTPLNQFNQLPAYFINNASLEQQIRSYNEELAKLQQVYKEKSKYDTSYFIPIERSRDDLINKLDTEKRELLKPNSVPQRKRFYTRQPSEKLIALFNSRDSITEIYSDQLERYQKKLSQTQVSDLMDSLVAPQIQTVQPAEISRYILLPNSALKWLWVVLLLAVFVGIIPFFIGFFRRYKSPIVKRLEDLDISLRTESSKLELNKNVNQELVAFNYGELIQEVERLAKKPSLIVFNSVEAEKEQYIISVQLGALLAKLGNEVLHINLSNQFDRQYTDNVYTYDFIEFIGNAERIKNQLCQTMEKKTEGPVLVNIVKTFRTGDVKGESGLNDYGSLQHFFAKAGLKEILLTLKQHFNYVIIGTPDFLALDSSLLAVPQKEINVYVFKAGITQRKSANMLCKLSESESTATIHVLDFSEKTIQQISPNLLAKTKQIKTLA